MSRTSDFLSVAKVHESVDHKLTSSLVPLQLSVEYSGVSFNIRADLKRTGMKYSFPVRETKSKIIPLISISN